VLFLAVFHTGTAAATPTLEMQETLIFSGSTCINQFYRASLRRASANRMNAISAPSPRAFTASFACPRFSICARAKRRHRWRANQAPLRSRCRFLDTAGAPNASSRPRRMVSSHHMNLSLAARRRVGHIGLNGDVAEWLKAAVC